MFITHLLLLRPAPLLCILLLLQSAHSIIATSHVGILQLTEGLNVSVAELLDQPARLRGYGDGIFLPWLSSPGFNSTDPDESTGFSFGFFSTSSEDFSNIFLAVCGGLSGNDSHSFSSGDVIGVRVGGTVGININVPNILPASPNSYAVPVWTANTNKPLKSINSSLVVSRVAPGRNVLRLRDENDSVVWWINDVGLMEMKDSGNLVIYDTIHQNRMVFQSIKQPRDTLVQNQTLSVGMELTSNDQSYLARMEKGGLVFYLNKLAQFMGHPSAYAVIPPTFDSELSGLELKKQILASPCELPYMVLNSYTLDLWCTSDNETTWYDFWEEFSSVSSPWSFLQLGNDGRLHLHVVDTTNPSSTVTNSSIPQLAQNYDDWEVCGVPMACGSLSVCTPFVTSSCQCPRPSQEGINLFKLIDPHDDRKGCKPVTPLPDCIRGDEHINTTRYLQLNETASILLFSGAWPFAWTTTTTRVDECKKLCSVNCSCTGFFLYTAANTSSACFFMTEGISLVQSNSQNATALSSYVTYLKVSDLAHTSNDSTIQATSAAKNDQHEFTKQFTSASNGKHEFTIAIAIVSSFLACSFTLGLFVYLFLVRRKRKAQDKARQAEEKQLRDILPLLPSRFSYQELHKATGGFNKLLGAGGCGSVYAGVLPDGRKIAAKVLESGILKGHQSKQFLAEVATVGHTSHHNIVCLIGFCWEVSHRLLVYEYMERGSLDRWLFAKDVDGETTPLLDWQTRYNVALGIARGLTYLHEECPQPILHFDIKPQNILLDDAYVAKLADFGLSKLMQRGVSEVVTVLRGTPGYIAPEWLSHGAVTKKSDIYSLGMVMLEIVGGRKNVDLTLISSVGDEWHFPSWAAKKCEKGFMLELVDKRIAEAYDKEQACRLIQTAFWCIHENASMRPCAPTVLQWLEGNSPVKPPPFSAIASALSSIEVS